MSFVNQVASTSEGAEFPWIDILDVPVDLMTERDIRGWLHRQLSTGSSCAHVVTLNPEYVMTARRDHEFAAILRQAELVTVDGAGVSAAIRLLDLEHHAVDRVTGVALCGMLAGIARETGGGMFLLGAEPGVAEKAGEALQASHPGVIIAGIWADGSPGEVDDAETLHRIAETGASIILVAYGAPSQITWIARNQSALSAIGVKVVVGVGGALDYISGNVPWAPALVRKLGLEWAYRLIREPWRWKRQCVLPLFATLVLRDAIRQRMPSRRLA